KIANILFANIPAGVGVEGKIRLNAKEMQFMLENGAKWAVQYGFGDKADLAFVEERGKMAGAVSEYVSEFTKKRQRGEVGTFGSGNHYLELQVVDEIFDAAAAKAFDLVPGQVIISIHCGSRGLGHQIGTDYLIILAKAAHKLGIQLPERELASAPILSAEGQQYI